MHAQPSLEQLFCALMFLLSRYAQSPEPELPPAIREHLIWVVEHPDTAELPALRSTCRRLALYWESRESNGYGGVEAAEMHGGGRMH